MKIGEYNDLTVSRLVDFGAYLTDGKASSTEVLLPNRYITEPLAEGDKVRAFVYTDSDDRPVAVTDSPLATVGEFAYLTVVAVNKVGAFLDWGLPKDLLCPFREQKARMAEGRKYLVYVYLDDTTGRVAASGKIEKWLDNCYPDFHAGQQVDALVYKSTDIGYGCIVNNRHSGMIYHDDVHAPLEIGEVVKCAVHKVRSDGKLDLKMGGNARSRSEDLSGKIYDSLIQNGRLAVSDRSTPDEISAAFGCSKKDFKKAVGALFKTKKIEIDRQTGAISLSKRD